MKLCSQITSGFPQRKLLKNQTNFTISRMFGTIKFVIDFHRSLHHNRPNVVFHYSKVLVLKA